MPVQMMHDPVSLSADVCACNDESPAQTIKKKHVGRSSGSPL